MLLEWTGAYSNLLVQRGSWFRRIGRCSKLRSWWGFCVTCGTDSYPGRCEGPNRIWLLGKDVELEKWVFSHSKLRKMR
jgi:hypothetical protein